MKSFITLAFVLSAAAANAQAAHPAVEACGGATINRDDGYRDRRVISNRTEKRIESFLQRADGSPGVSIVVVKGDRIVYLRGFGFRDLDACTKATGDTRYYLKSTTKTFLGAAAAVLQEEGAIELDAPISDYLPDLKFPDGMTPRQTSIRAHLTHTQPYFDSGLNYRTAFPGNLPEGDFVAHVNQYSSAGDTRFRYSNFGPIMAAHAIGAKTGTNWRDFIRKKVFEPAGMTNSFTSMAEAEKGPMATGYVGGEDPEYSPTLTKVDNQMHAAGGAVSTAADLGRWLIISLSGGRIDGEQAIPKRALEQTQARQAQMHTSYSEYERFAYGLGLYSADYDGDLLVHHFGGETHLSYMPERGLGVAVLANDLGFADAITHRLASTIYDMLLDKPDVDERIERRLEEIGKSRTEHFDRLKQYIAQMEQRAPSGESTYTLENLVGAYFDPRLGEMSVVRDGDSLKIVFGAQTGPLTHLGGDAWLADFGLWRNMPPQVFVFREDKDLGFVLDWGGRIFARRN